MLVLVVGAIGGISAALLVQLLRLVQAVAWQGHGESFLAATSAATGLRRWMVPALAGVMVTAAALATRRPLRGHGTASIIESIWIRSGRLALPWTLFRGVVSIIAVGLGAPLGREGALLQTGAATASSLGRWLDLPGDKIRLLVACGASAGIAAAYNVPIGGALFGLEVLLGSFALDLFGPIVVACVTATLVSRILVGDHPSYLIPAYQLSGPKEMTLALLLGPLVGIASAVYIRTINAFGLVLEQGSELRRTALPVVTMLAIGGAAIWFPELLGNGYDSVNGALLGKLPLTLLLVLPLMKMVATAGASGAGIPGGLFTPSLFFGALLGGAFGKLAQHFGAPVPPGAFALLAMAGTLAGTTHAAVSAVLIIFELTGNYALILPLMLTSAISAFVSRALERESLYSAVLQRRNVELPEPINAHWLHSAHVRDLTRPARAKTLPVASFEEVALQLLEAPAGADLWVVDEENRLLGVITLDQLKGHLPEHSVLDRARASDLMQSTPRLRPDMSLAEVARIFAEVPEEELPVVDKRGLLLGTVNKREVMRRGRY
ncbi:MAG: chloride channel protein [Myxococcaceae bacterium]|nr:chloride channel protein [Myxococcaceae bacterium]